VHPFDLFPQVFDAHPVNESPSIARTIRKNLKALWRWNEIIHFTLEPWLSLTNFLERTNLQSL